MNNFLRRFTIRQRLLGSVWVISLMTIALGAWATLAMQSSQREAGRMLDSQMQVSHDTGGLLSALERVQRLEQSVMLNAGNTLEAGDFQVLWKKEVAATRALIKSTLSSPERVATLGEGAAGFESYAQALEPLLQQVVDAKMDASAAFAYASRALPELDKARASFTGYVTQTEARLAEEHQAAKRQAEVQSSVRVGAALLLLAGFAFVMWRMVSSIVQPLKQASELAQRIAGGDLSVRVEVVGQDEIARFMQSLQLMQGSLHTVVDQVRVSADSILTASNEVANGNLDLSQRTEQAASNLQATAASMTELTGTLRNSADAASQATQLAGSASTVARQGGQRVAQAVQTMEEINQSSRKIADITGVIDSIAFQTNILALNAAVEAARAGEQGRGFAVVAGEVRTLAQRSAEAAREIRSLIGASVERVEGGTRQVQEAGQTMTEIVNSVQRVADIIAKISLAASEQSRGMDAVGISVSQLDQMTQQNAALVEQSAAAAESLKLQANDLSTAVGTFRLN